MHYQFSVLILFCCIVQLFYPKIAGSQTGTIKVMAWDILHGVNDIPNGRRHAIEIIKSLAPDLIMMVETYGSGRAIADSL